MATDMGDLEKALGAAAPALATAGGEQNTLTPADLRVHPMGGGAINKFVAKLNPDLLNWPLLFYCLIVVCVLALTNHLFVGGSGQHVVPKNQPLITPMLTVIPVFVVFLAAICLMVRAVIKPAT